MRVLIVEDELRMASLIRRGLVNEGLAADVAANGEDALWMAEAHDYDAIVLDVMLPGIDGFETCRRLRGAGVWAPVLMLTARDAVEDRVAGLDTGADDYLVKPFAFAELLARLRALARRGETASGRPCSRSATCALDPATREVARGDDEIALSAKEFALLETFMRRPGEVLSRLHLLEHAWDFAYENRSNVVDVYIRRLRRKIDEPFGRRVARDGARRRLPAAARTRVSRLPIRVRVAAAFARRDGGGARRRRAGSSTRGSASHLALALDRELRLRAQDLGGARPPAAARSLARDGGGRFVERGESYAQLLDADGRVLDATPPLGRAPAPRPRRAARGARTATGLRRHAVGSGPGRAARACSRRRSTRDGRRLVLVVGATRAGTTPRRSRASATSC